MSLQLRIIGLGGEVCTVEADESQTVGYVQKALEAATGVLAREQRLLLGTQELRDRNAKLKDINLGELLDAELTLIRRDPQQAEWLQIVEADFAGNQLQRAPSPIREDREVIFAAMRRRPTAFRFAAAKLKADRDFMLAVVKENQNALQHASRELLGDREVVLEAVKGYGSAVQFASRELRADHEIALAVAKSDVQALRYLSHQLWSDREFMLAAVQQNGLALQFASGRLQSDQELVLAAASNDGDALQHAAPALKEDEAFIMAAAKVTCKALKHASQQLQRSLPLISAVVRENGEALRFASESARSMRKMVLAAVQTHAEAVTFAGRSLWNGAFFLEAVEVNKGALWFCPSSLKGQRGWILNASRITDEALDFAVEELRCDRELVAAAGSNFASALRFAAPEVLSDRSFISRVPAALQFAPEAFRADRELVMAAVRADGLQLTHACEALRADGAVVLAAVNSQGIALEFAAEELRAEPELVLAAAKGCREALLHAAAGLWADRDFVLRAVQDNAAALQFAAAELWTDRDFVCEAVKRNGSALAHAPDELKADEELKRIAGPMEAERPPQSTFGRRQPRALVTVGSVARPNRRAAARDAPELEVSTEASNASEPSAAAVASSAPAPREHRASIRSSGHGIRLLPRCLPTPTQAPKLVRTSLRNLPREPPLSSIDSARLGSTLQVLPDAEAVVRACHDAGLDVADEGRWTASAGACAQVLALDAIDGSVEVRVPGVGDVWLACAALLPCAQEEPLDSMEDATVGSELQVLSDAASVIAACHDADLGAIEDRESWEASVGKKVQVLRRDARDSTVECHVPGVGDVWFALTALTLA